MSEHIQNTEATPASSNPTAAILTGAALLGGAALFANPKAARAQTKSQIPFTEAVFGNAANDFKILNFALSLEALENDLYNQALQRLTGGGTNALGKRITGLNQPTSSAAVEYFQRFGKVELAHLNFLNNTLGASSILAPGKALNGAKFDFGLDDASRYPNVASVVELVRLAEATGVMAYIGAIPQFKTTTFLQTAAAIEGTEGRHTAVITAILNGLDGGSRPVAPLAPNGNGNGNTNNGRETFKAPQEIIDQIRPFIVLKGEAGNPA